VVPLHWWPLTRDCLAYGVTVMILICIIHDERVEWYEAMVLVTLYTVYIAGETLINFVNLCNISLNPNEFVVTYPPVLFLKFPDSS
jgi:hypothetical protein